MTLKFPACYSLLVSLSVLLATTTSLPASADDQLVNESPSMRVRVADLDLNTDAGRRELLNRLSKAAARVCEAYANANWSLGYSQIYRSCFRSSLAAAVNKVHHEQVSALFAAQ